jgi:hypothetical protein
MPWLQEMAAVARCFHKSTNIKMPGSSGFCSFVASVAANISDQWSTELLSHDYSKNTQNLVSRPDFSK